MSEGLARLGGNSRLYGRLLLNFARQCETTLGAFESALQTQDENRLRLLAHELKGVAGGLGVKVVEQSARNLEFGADDYIRAEYHTLSTSLREICERIVERLANWSNSYGSSSLSKISLQRLWEKLQSELQSFDGEALDSWSELSVRLKGRLHPTELEHLEALILGLDFKSAASALKNLGERLGPLETGALADLDHTRAHRPGAY